MIHHSQNRKNLTVGRSRHFLISIMTRLRLRKRQNRTLCPSCHRDHTELVNQVEDEEGYWKKEEYLCDDCGCQWDWTHERPYFRWHVKIRAPGWMKVE